MITIGVNDRYVAITLNNSAQREEERSVMDLGY